MILHESQKYLADNPIFLTVDLVRQIFDILIDRTTENLKPSDLIGVCKQSEHLDRPTSTCLVKVEELTIEKILSVVTKVLQSNEEKRLDREFLIDVITMRRDIG